MATSGPSLKALPPLLPDPPHPSFPYILISRLICCLAPLLPSLIPPIFPHHARRCLKEEKDCCSWFSLSRCATPVPTSFPHSPSDPSLPFFFFFFLSFSPRLAQGNPHSLSSILRTILSSPTIPPSRVPSQSQSTTKVSTMTVTSSTPPVRYAPLHPRHHPTTTA